MSEIGSEPTVVWSDDGETFNADSVGDLLDGNDELAPGRIVYFGEAVKPSTNFVNADDVIEMIADRAYDIGGEHADDFPSVSGEAKAELAALLSAWQEKHCQPDFWSVRKVKEYTLTEADFAALKE